MSFLVKLLGGLGKILGPLLPYVLDWAWGKIENWKKSREEKSKSEKDNKEVREENEKATTPEEREKAADKIIGGY